MIRFGHSWSEIQEYSFGQIQLFLEAAREIEAEERRSALLDSAVAAQGTSQLIESRLKELKNG